MQESNFCCTCHFFHRHLTISAFTPYQQVIPSSSSTMASKTPPPDLDLDLTFLTFSGMCKHVEAHALRSGFITSNNAKESFSANNWPFESSFTPSVPKRGYITCSSKSNNRCLKSNCPFKLSFCFSSKIQSYVFRPQFSILSHNHPLIPHQFMFDGRELVKYIDLLLPEEEASIKTQINCKVSLKKCK